MSTMRIFSWMVSMYPASVRREFGSEMLAVFQERASEKGVSAARMLLRELSTFPGTLTAAWMEEPGSGERVPRPLLWSAILIIMVAASWRTTHLVANVGLAALTSLALLTITLLFSGAALGLVVRARSRNVTLAIGAVTLAVLAAGVGLLPLFDNAITTARAGRASSLSLPGVRVQSFASSSPQAVSRYVEAHRDALTPRVRVEVQASGSTTVARIVHAGGVDWLYLVFAFCLLGGGFHWSSRNDRNEVTS